MANSDVKYDFSENFWHKDAKGWRVLYKNFKDSIESVKDFEAYLQESSINEKYYAKQMISFKFSRHISSMSPVWNDLISVWNQSNAQVHSIFQIRLKELIQDLRKYRSYLLTKKKKINESERSTKKLVKLHKKLSKHLEKNREKYFEVNKKLEKQCKLVETNKSAIIEVQSLKRKQKIAQKNYETSIQNYNSRHQDYTKKFTDSCNLFQSEEVSYLKTMRLFMNTYTKLIEQLNSSREKLCAELIRKLNSHYTNKFLFENLIALKKLGHERPVNVEFESLKQPSSTIIRQDDSYKPNELSITNKSQELPLIDKKTDRSKQIKSRFSFQKNTAISRSNLLIMAVVSEAFDKQIEKINEFEQEKTDDLNKQIRATNNKRNSIIQEKCIQNKQQQQQHSNLFFENMDDFFDTIKNKHSRV